MPPEQKPVVVVGSINMDLVATSPHIPAPGETVLGTGFATHPGGKGANQAVAVARLGYPVHLVGRLGDDGFGNQLREHLEAAGVGVAAVATTPGSSGVAVILVARNGENSIVVSPGANALLTPADLDANLDLLRSAGVVLAQLEIPLETVTHLARICTREGLPLILDPAPARDLPPGLFAHLTWFTPNETEAAFFLGRAPAAATPAPPDVAADGADARATPAAPEAPARIARELLNRGPRGVILKLGARGAYLATGSGTGDPVSPFPVQPVDSTAAGDCFNGAFATALLLGRNPLQSAQFAAAAAAISVTRRGAQPSMPAFDEVEDLLATLASGPV